MLHIIRFVLIFKHFTRYFSHNNPLDNAYFYMLFINQSPLFNQKRIQNISFITIFTLSLQRKKRLWRNW